MLAAFVASAQDVPYKYQVEWDSLNGSTVTTFMGHRFECEVTSSVSNTGGGGGVGKTTALPVKIVRDWDESSPLLFGAVATGKHFRKVTISMGRVNHHGQFLPAVQYVFEDVIVTGFHAIAADQAIETLRLQQPRGTVYETNELEEVAFQYAKVTIRHLDSGNLFGWQPPL